MTAARNKIRVLIVDDHLVVRIGLRSLLEVQTDMEVVGEASGGMAALTQFQSVRPDVTLMDLRMSDQSGSAATAAIRQHAPEARIVVLTTFENDAGVYRALEAGATGFLLKDADGDTLLRAIREVYAGTYRLPATIAARLAQHQAAPKLSPRELEVLQLIVKGCSNKEIGATLGLAENTVKNHLKVVFEKLRVADRTQAATTALQRGLARLD
ncbi:MAG: response regulator transcription factor [Verrucomicrobiae bacterium]|nr:response regulator transcription factor [Verrucomicrobiae bacterium]